MKEVPMQSQHPPSRMAYPKILARIWHILKSNSKFVEENNFLGCLAPNSGFSPKI